MQVAKGKALVRKLPQRGSGVSGPVTMILLLVDGDMRSLTDEALHALRVFDTGGSLTLTVEKVKETDEFRGLRADQVITQL